MTYHIPRPLIDATELDTLISNPSHTPTNTPTNPPTNPPTNTLTNSLDDVLFVPERIGSGSFSNVYKCKIEDKRYAVKCIQKDALKSHHRKQFLNEIQVLQTANHPMMIQFVHAFQDTETIYIVTELLVCGDLFDYLASVTLKESQVIFYVANVVMMLDHLHTNNIIYRDLKAENIVMMENGYLKLIDFGFAKILEPDEKTRTILGTPGYISPEIITGMGYSYPVDWWALGVFAYDIMFNSLPFGENLVEILKLAKQPVEFPNDTRFGPKITNFVSDLLRYEPDKRPTRFTIKSHPLFLDCGMNWDRLGLQRVTPDHIPPKKRFSSAYIKYSEITMSQPFSA